MIKQLSIAAALTITSITLSFASNDGVDYQINVPHGLYVNGQVGYIHNNVPGDSTSLKRTQNNLGYAAAVGYDWALDSYSALGLRLGYLRMGETSYKSAGTNALSIHESGYTLMTRLTELFSYNIEGEFGIGAAYVTQNNQLDNTSNPPSPLISASNHKTHGLHPILTLGIGYAFNTHADIRLFTTYLLGSSQHKFVNNAGTAPADDMNHTASAWFVGTGINIYF